ncbi:MAG: hypothetical protein ACFCUI_01760 [Bernardetiaceae bacterium]
MKANRRSVYLLVMKQYGLIWFWLFLLCSQAYGQGDKAEFVDYRPIYRKWKDIYILDKIEYRDEEIVLFFRFIDNNGGWASFYGPGKPYAWQLQDIEDKTRVFPLRSIRNIRSNDTLRHAHLGEGQQVRYDTKVGDIFTCEIHFDRLPLGISRVHLIEGAGQETNENHFNCFDIRIKQLGSTDLGSVADMETRIEDFKSPEKATLIPELLMMVNGLRTQDGFCSRHRVPAAPPLEWSEPLAEAAKGLVLEIWKADQLRTPDGAKTVRERLARQGYQTDLAYETLIYDATDAKQAFARWQAMGAQCMRMRDGRLRVMGAARKGPYWLMLLAR